MIHLIAQDTGHSIRCICLCLEVPRSSYYHAATPTDTQVGGRTVSGKMTWDHWELLMFNAHRA